MANNTIYPYGTGGQTPSGIAIADDLNTESAQEALSAKQGVVLNTKVTAVADMLVAVGQSIDGILKKAAYKEGNVAADITELENILSASLTGISVAFSHSGVYYDKQGLDGLREYLTVTAYYLDGTESEVSAYSLSGTLAEGTQTITVTYLGKTATFNVIVEEVDYYRGPDAIVYKIALRSAFTSSNKKYAATINGVQYYYTQTPSGSTAVNYRACYYLFDLLWTPGETYDIEFFYHGKPSGYSVVIGLQGYNQAFYNDGAANSSTPKDHTSDITDGGWQTPTDSGTSLKISNFSAYTDTKGTRFVFKTTNNGSDAEWPTGFAFDYFIIKKTS